LIGYMKRVALSVVSALWLVPLYFGLRGGVHYVLVDPVVNSFPLMGSYAQLVALSLGLLGLTLAAWTYVVARTRRWLAAIAAGLSVAPVIAAGIPLYVALVAAYGNGMRPVPGTGGDVAAVVPVLVLFVMVASVVCTGWIVAMGWARGSGATRQ
jgi:hypothetical protein